MALMVEDSIQAIGACPNKVGWVTPAIWTLLLHGLNTKPKICYSSHELNNKLLPGCQNSEQVKVCYSNVPHIQRLPFSRYSFFRFPQYKMKDNQPDSSDNWWFCGRSRNFCQIFDQSSKNSGREKFRSNILVLGCVTNHPRSSAQYVCLVQSGQNCVQGFNTVAFEQLTRKMKTTNK